MQEAVTEDKHIIDLYKVAAIFFNDLKKLRLVLQPSKSGYVATTSKLGRAFAPFAEKLGIVKRREARNLGHELHGSKVMRAQERKRMQALQAKMRRVRILKQAVGAKGARLFRTGLLPSAGHGARVYGVTDAALRQRRAVAGELVGARPAASLTTYLFMQADSSYDPVVDCTVAPIHAYSAWVWEGRGSLGKAQGTWKAMEPNMATGGSWATARGALSATWLSLMRIGWDMRGAHLIQDDLGRVLSLLHPDLPAFIRDLYKASIDPRTAVSRIRL